MVLHIGINMTPILSEFVAVIALGELLRGQLGSHTEIHWY
jgi:hypothetical protein